MGIKEQNKTSDRISVRSLKKSRKRNLLTRVCLASKFTTVIHTTQERRESARFERPQWTAQRSSTETRRARRDLLRASVPFSTCGLRPVAGASAVGSGGEPALFQTPATTGTNGRPGRESVASSTPTPTTKLSRPSAESGGAEPRNAVSSWLLGRGASASGAGCQNRRSAAASEPDSPDAPSSRRSLLRMSVRCQTQKRAEPQRVRIGWCGAVSDSGGATSVRTISSRVSNCEMQSEENSGSLQFGHERRAGDVKSPEVIRNSQTNSGD